MLNVTLPFLDKPREQGQQDEGWDNIAFFNTHHKNGLRQDIRCVLPAWHCSTLQSEDEDVLRRRGFQIETETLHNFILDFNGLYGNGFAIGLMTFTKEQYEGQLQLMCVEASWVRQFGIGKHE